jgi:hypothetical protein
MFIQPVYMRRMHLFEVEMFIYPVYMRRIHLFEIEMFIHPVYMKCSYIVCILLFTHFPVWIVMSNTLQRDAYVSYTQDIWTSQSQRDVYVSYTEDISTSMSCANNLRLKYVKLSMLQYIGSIFKINTSCN